MKLQLTLVLRKRTTWTEVRSTLIRLVRRLQDEFPDEPGGGSYRVESTPMSMLKLHVLDPKGDRVGSLRIVLDEDED